MEEKMTLLLLEFLHQVFECGRAFLAVQCSTANGVVLTVEAVEEPYNSQNQNILKSLAFGIVGRQIVINFVPHLLVGKSVVGDRK